MDYGSRLGSDCNKAVRFCCAATEVVVVRHERGVPFGEDPAFPRRLGAFQKSKAQSRGGCSASLRSRTSHIPPFSQTAAVPRSTSSCSRVTFINHQVVTIHHPSISSSSRRRSNNNNRRDRLAHVRKVTLRPPARPPSHHQTPSPTCRGTTHTTTPRQLAPVVCTTPNRSLSRNSTPAVGTPSAVMAIHSMISMLPALPMDRGTTRPSPIYSHTRQRRTRLPLRTA